MPAKYRGHVKLPRCFFFNSPSISPSFEPLTQHFADFSQPNYITLYQTSNPTHPTTFKMKTALITLLVTLLAASAVSASPLSYLKARKICLFGGCDVNGVDCSSPAQSESTLCQQGGPGGFNY